MNQASTVAYKYRLCRVVRNVMYQWAGRLRSVRPPRLYCGVGSRDVVPGRSRHRTRPVWHRSCCLLLQLMSLMLLPTSPSSNPSAHHPSSSSLRLGDEHRSGTYIYVGLFDSTQSEFEFSPFDRMFVEFGIRNMSLLTRQQHNAMLEITKNLGQSPTRVRPAP